MNLPFSHDVKQAKSLGTIRENVGKEMNSKAGGHPLHVCFSANRAMWSRKNLGPMFCGDELR